MIRSRHRCVVHGTQKAVSGFEMRLNEGHRRTGVGTDGKLSGEIVTGTVFERMTDAVMLGRVIGVSKLTPIENAEDVTGTRLLFDKLLQRFDEPLQRHLAAGKRRLLRCRNRKSGCAPLRMLHRLTNHRKITPSKTLVPKIHFNSMP